MKHGDAKKRGELMELDEKKIKEQKKKQDKDRISSKRRRGKEYHQKKTVRGYSSGGGSRSKM